MTLLEAEPQRLAELFRHLPQSQWPRPRLVLGITGAPGTGKSTLVDATVAELRQRSPSNLVGVIAVDPSSPFTGGAVLGDRVRMMRHATDPLVFIRSLATRGHLGGLSLGVKGVLRVMALLGCDVVLIETVGVGQSEIEIARVADLVGVVLAPGAGDSVQMLKAGLMEVGDVFVVNKADAAGADALHRSLIQTLGLAAAARANGAAGPHRPQPEVLLTSANEGRGIAGLVDWMSRQQRETDDVRDADSAQADVRDAVLESARRRLDARLTAEPELLAAVLAGAVTVDELVDRLFAEQLNP
jgi:LAO/AO transport system kinase